MPCRRREGVREGGWEGVREGGWEGVREGGWREGGEVKEPTLAANGSFCDTTREGGSWRRETGRERTSKTL